MSSKISTIMADPISDMLIRIQNAQRAGHKAVSMPFSKFKFALAKILEKHGYVGDILKRGKKLKKFFEINLLYKDKNPRISGIRRVSKQGKRIYLPKEKIKPVKQGYGMHVISTSKGLMSDKEAKKEGVGGEVIAEVW